MKHVGGTRWRYHGSSSSSSQVCHNSSRSGHTKISRGFGGVSLWEDNGPGQRHIQQQQSRPPQQKWEPPCERRGKCEGGSQWEMGAARPPQQLQQWQAPEEQRHPGPALGWWDRADRTHGTGSQWGAPEAGSPPRGEFEGVGGRPELFSGQPTNWGKGGGEEEEEGREGVASLPF